MIPLFVAALLYNKVHLALAIFTVAVLTDAADGFIARKFDQKTRFGAMIDPIADKLLIVTAFICLMFVREIPPHLRLPPYVFIVVISRDAIILLGSVMIILVKGIIDVKPSVLGKATTFFQMITVIAILLSFEYSRIVWTVMLIFTLASGAGYIVRGTQLLNDNSRKR